MTAEIAILNRNGVALAADSAGTLLLPSGPKITNTESKLFMLSKYAPVGIMVYGGSQLMGVPWETIIKTYRHDLKAKEYEHLEDYASEFIRFLEREELLFPAELQANYAGTCLELGFGKLKKEIEEEVSRVISSKGSIDDFQVKDLARSRSLKFFREVEKSEYLRGFGSDDVDCFAKQYEQTIRTVLADTFQQLPISDCIDQLVRAGALMALQPVP